MKNLVRIFLACLAFLFASAAHAQIDISVTGATPLSNVRQYKGDASDVTVSLKNAGASISKDIKVKVTIRTYTGILVYADSITIDPLAKNQSTIATLADFFPPETAHYSVSASATTPNDVDQFNNLFSNQRLPVQFDVAVMGITAPLSNQSFLQKLTFPIRGRFRSLSFIQELDVKARVVIRRCFDNAIVFIADTAIPDLPKDTVTVNFTFPSQQGIYDVRKLQPGCYKLAMMTSFLSDWNRSNDTAYTTFNINANTLPNDVSIDSIYSTKGATLKPGEEMPLTLWFGNVGLNTQSSVPTSLVVTNEKNEEVYRESMTLTNWIVGETKTEIFPAFKSDVAGTYTLHAFTSLPNDEFRFNDTLTRTASVEKVFSVKLDSLLLPQAGAVYENGVDNVPRARFSWGSNTLPTGIITTVLTIKSSDGKNAYTSEQDLIGFSESVHSLEVEYPFQTPLADLPNGLYTAALAITIDEKVIGTITPITFRIGYKHDIAIDSLINPEPYKAYPLHDVGGIEIALIAANLGVEPESHVILEASVYDRFGSIVHWALDSFSVGSNSQERLALPQFVASYKGMYDAAFKLSLPVEGDTTNNSAHFRFNVGSGYDMLFSTPVDPNYMDKKTRGVSFIPMVGVNWFGFDNIETKVDLMLRVTACNNDAILYEQKIQELVTPAFDERTMFFPRANKDGVEISDLPIGCYEARFIATHPLDTDHSDDTLFVPFSIEEQNSVASIGDTRISIKQSGHALTLSGLPSKSSVSVFDIRGVQLARVPNTSETASIDLGAATSGTYVIELRHDDLVERQLVNYVK